MKNTAAYYLLILYILAVCKPILPLVQDEVAHLFWKTEHVAKVHAHNGSNHVHKEIASTTKKENKDTNTTTSKTGENVSIHMITTEPGSLQGPIQGLQLFGIVSPTIFFLFTNKHYPPPKAC